MWCFSSSSLVNFNRLFGSGFHCSVILSISDLLERPCGICSHVYAHSLHSRELMHKLVGLVKITLLGLWANGDNFIDQVLHHTCLLKILHLVYILRDLLNLPKIIRGRYQYSSIFNEGTNQKHVCKSCHCISAVS